MTSENTEHRPKSALAAPWSGKDSAPDGSRPGAGGGRAAVLAGCALAAQSLHGWLTNGSIFASVIPYFPLARDLNMAFSVVAFALVALAAFYRPRLLDLGQMALVSACSVPRSSCRWPPKRRARRSRPSACSCIRWGASGPPPWPFSPSPRSPPHGSEASSPQPACSQEHFCHFFSQRPARS